MEQPGELAGAPGPEPVTIDELAITVGAILDEMERAVVGKRAVLELVVAGLLADGHLLIEDVPGVAKTLIARSLAEVTGLRFSRIQFTPDLIPSDLTGTVVPGPDGTPTFAPGPLFANAVLGDEINRSPAKTQAAALEAMEERQVTVDGRAHPLPRPYLLIATQNPVDAEGTYPLPEAQLDRFLARIHVGYPEPDHERELVRRRLDRGADRVALRAVTDAAGIRSLQATVERIEAGDDVVDYAVRLVEATRAHPDLEIGSSPRGGLALLKLARARAALAGRPYATPDDVKQLAVAVLAHRVVLRTEAWVRGRREEDVIGDCLDQVATPATLTDADRAKLQEPASGPTG